MFTRNIFKCSFYKQKKLIMDKKNLQPSLNGLYKNEFIRDLIRDVLTEEFNEAFERLLKEAREIKSLLIKPAKLHRNEIKELFIEFGYPMETLEHLKKMLDTLKLWNDIDEVDECDGCDDSQISK